MNMTMTTTMQRKPAGMGMAFLKTAWKMFTKLAWLPAFVVSARMDAGMVVAYGMLVGAVVLFYVVTPVAARFVKSPALRFLLAPSADDAARRLLKPSKVGRWQHAVDSFFASYNGGGARQHLDSDLPMASGSSQRFVNPATGLPMVNQHDTGGFIYGTGMQDRQM